MQQPNHEHDLAFPLHDLFRRLELAGFVLSPADRTRALRVLASAGKAYVDEPQRLRWLLAPILTRTAAEQAQFYQIFDQYWAALQASPTLPMPPAETPRRPFWRWLPVLLLAAAIIGWFVYIPDPPPVLAVNFSIQPDTAALHVGDSLRLRNTTEVGGERDRYAVRWEWIDVATNTVELADSSWHWMLVVPPLSNDNFARAVRLQMTDPETGIGGSRTLPVTITCLSPPAVKAIIADRQGAAGEGLRFRLNGEEGGPWTYTWDFGDSSALARTREPSHTYTQNGRYTVNLTIVDTAAAGYCRTELSHDINIGIEKAFLLPLPLERDAPGRTAQFTGWWRVLLGLLALGVIVLFVRYARDMGRRLRAAAKKAAAAVTTFLRKDQAPYFIPFRQQDQQVAIAPEALRLAEALRLRQTGLRRELDVKATLAATVAEGGFPRVRFAFNTQPSEYLLLVDEQHELSHLGRLFHYLVELLRGQDVYLETYYYRRHLNRFWNRQHPEGISLELLYRQYPAYRLLLFGDVHDLVEPHAVGTPALRTAFVNDLLQWRVRLLFTPVPPVSWTYREKLLGRHFTLFPADVDGLAAAARYLESDLEATDLPDHDRYQQQLIRQRQDADTAYRRWRRWADYEEFVAHYPGLGTWLRALAIYPTPTWETTIALGRALAPWGVEVTYDQLLQLARIPDLQVGRWNERVRREMLAGLDPEVEARARAALRDELAAVAREAQAGFAGVELATELAIQQFALDPGDAGHQQTLRALMEQNLLKPTRETELDRITARTAAPANVVSQKAAPMDNGGPKLREFLTNRPPETERPVRPLDFFTRRFWQALAAFGVLMALLSFTRYFNQTEPLHDFFFDDDKAAYGQPLQRRMLVSEVYQADEAVNLNNQAVALYEQSPDTAVAGLLRQALDPMLNMERTGTNWSLYPIATNNLAKVYYNAALQAYHSYLNGTADASALRYALRTLKQAPLPAEPILADIHHAFGLIYHYLNQVDSARWYYESVNEVGYFDTLSLLPNLKTLLNLESSRLLKVAAEPNASGGATVRVDYYLNSARDPAANLYVRVRSFQGDTLFLPEIIRREADFGPNTLELTLNPPRRSGGRARSDSLQVVLVNANDQLLDEETIPFAFDWTREATTASRFSLRGRVTDRSDRSTIYNANLTLSERTPSAKVSGLRIQAYSDRSGRFQLGGNLATAGNRAYDLVVTARGYLPYTRSLNERQLRNLSSLDIVLVPEPAQTPPEQQTQPTPSPPGQKMPPRAQEQRQERVSTWLESVILDAATGLPLPNANVWLWNKENKNDAGSTTYVGSSGTFRITLPNLDSPQELVVQRDGYLPLTRELSVLLLAQKAIDSEAIELRRLIGVREQIDLIRRECSDCQFSLTRYEYGKNADNPTVTTRTFQQIDEAVKYATYASGSRSFITVTDPAEQVGATKGESCVVCHASSQERPSGAGERRCFTSPVALTDYLTNFRRQTAARGLASFCYLELR